MCLHVQEAETYHSPTSTESPEKIYASPSGEWYSEYVNLTAAKIYNGHYGVDTTKLMYDKSYSSILVNLGFKTKDEIDREYQGKDPKPYPSVKQIAKAIAN